MIPRPRSEMARTNIRKTTTTKANSTRDCPCFAGRGIGRGLVDKGASGSDAPLPSRGRSFTWPPPPWSLNQADLLQLRKRGRHGPPGDTAAVVHPPYHRARKGPPVAVGHRVQLHRDETNHVDGGFSIG